jgi:hypothetical protein
MTLRYRIREWLGINALSHVVCLYRDAISEAEAGQRKTIDALAAQVAAQAQQVMECEALMSRTGEIMNAAFDAIAAAETFYTELIQRQRVPQDELEALRVALADFQKAGVLQ